MKLFSDSSSRNPPKPPQPPLRERPDPKRNRGDSPRPCAPPASPPPPRPKDR